MFFVDLRGQQYASSWYTTDNGLPQNSVKDIIRDRYGYIWLSTEQGVVRYDGNRFLNTKVVFDNPHFKIFRGSIAEDRIMVLNNEEKEGLMIRRRKVMKTGPLPAAGDLCSRAGQLVHRYYKRNLTEPTPFSFYLIELRTSSYLFSDGRIAYTGKNGSREIRLPFKVRNMKDVFVHGDTVFIPDRKARRIIKIENGKISKETSPLYTDQDSVIYWEQITGQVMVINRDTVYLSRYGKNTLSAEKLVHYPGFGNQQFYSMYYDTTYRTLYLGSLIKGLNIVKLPDFSIARRSIPFMDDNFISVLDFGKDQVITAQGYVFNRNSLVRKYGFNKDNLNSSLFYDPQRNIVCFNAYSIEKYDRASGYTRKTVSRTGFTINHIFRSEKFYFAVSNDNVLVRYPDASFSSAGRRYPFSAKINCIADYRGALLVGCNDGLFVIDPAKDKVKRMNGIRTGIRNICKTSDGSYWLLSTAKGIFLLRNGKPVRMPPDEDGFLLFPHHLMEDRKGFLWISTNNGLFRILKRNLLDYAANPATRLFYYRYSTADGLPTNEFNGGGKPCGNTLADGSFVFPSIDGLAFFRPENTAAYYPSRRAVSLERVKIDDLPVHYFNGALTLENSFGKAEFYIDVPYYADSKNLFIETRTDEGKWIKADNTRTVVFAEASPGVHTLSVRILGDDRGGFFYRTVSVYVKPLFYQTLWFRILCLFSAVLFVLLFIRMRTRNLERVMFLQDKKIKQVEQSLESKEKELRDETTYQEEFFQAITHDIATPIKHLSNLSQLMLESENPALQRKYFDSVYRSTEELYNLTINLREYRQAFNSTDIFSEAPYLLREAIGMKIKLFEDMAAYKNTRIINNVRPDIELTISFSIICIIFQNLLDNAVKNTDGGTIAFDACRNGSGITITLADTGKGMNPDYLNYYNALYESHNEEDIDFRHFGLGLHLVIRLIKKIHARIEFTGNQPRGTLVTIQLTDICLKKF